MYHKYIKITGYGGTDAPAAPYQCTLNVGGFAALVPQGLFYSDLITGVLERIKPSINLL